jgi:protein CLEC16A
MLLVETVAARLPEERYANVRASVGASGIVRAVAPLAGCSVAIDQSHRKWLHVRVRSPFACLAAVARSPPMHLIQGGSGKGGAAARRRLQDGHWTLAFLDEEACAAAKRMVDTRAAMLRDACTITLAPLTSRGAVGYT